MQGIFKATAAVAAVGAALEPASAAVVVLGDPQAVFPVDIQTNPNVVGQNIVVGRLVFVNGILVNSASGTLRVDATGGPTDVSTDQSILVGAQEATNGQVDIVGDGSAFSASLTAGDALVGGRLFGTLRSGSGVGALNIVNGGSLTLQGNDGAGNQVANGRLAVGVDQAGGNGMNTNQSGLFDGVVMIDGAQSRLAAGSVILGDPTNGYSANLSATNGATINIFDLRTVPAGFQTELSSFSVMSGSTASLDGAGTLLNVGGSLAVGGFTGAPSGPFAQSPGRFDILNGAAAVIGNTVTIGNGGQGVVSIDGAGSQLFVSGSAIGPLIGVGDIRIGAQSFDPTGSIFPGSGSLTVSNGGYAAAARDIYVGGSYPYFNLGDTPASGVLDVNTGGVVDAQRIIVGVNGTLQGSGGLLNANVVMNGGTLAPGNSPGDMTINGDLDFADPQSILSIEIAGANAGQYDVLTVLGDLIAPQGFTLELSFLNGFSPTPGDSFNFLSVAGTPSLDFSLVNLIVNGFSGGVQFAFDNISGVFSFSTDMNPSAVPLPPAFPLMVFGLGALGVAARRRKTVKRQADFAPIAQSSLHQ